MQRVIALACAGLLLALALALPFEAPAGVVCKLARLPAALAVSAFAGPPPRGEARTPQVDLVALLLFRGPPADGFSNALHSENPKPEGLSCRGRELSQKS